MQVTEDQRDHINRMPKEEEVYHKLLRDLEPSFEEEDWLPSYVYTLGVVHYL